MSNYHVQPVDRPQALTKEAIRSLRNHPVQGMSRRRLLRVSLGGGIALWLTEMVGGFIALFWPNLEGGFGDPHLRIGTLDEIKAQNAGIPVAAGFPAYFSEARAFIVLVDPARQAFVPGEDEIGDGTALNVRALYQRCPHLGCRPNFCTQNYWLECPCHGSRYDRLGVKAAGTAYGPAPRSMDRFAATVEADGTLYLNTSKITLGELPVAVGQPGIIPPKSPTGCI
jgi:cytochrome b6-f complex iron-sulfur subunit